jgi:hypothetical protein
MGTPTPYAVSSQDAVLFLLESEAGIDAILNWNGPVRFGDLPRIAESIGSTQAGFALDWLDDAIALGLSGVDDASVVVIEREPWVRGMEKLSEGPLPDELVAAAVIDVPAADRCLLVPTGGRQPGETIMLYAERQSGDAKLLVPIAATRGSAEAVPVLQPCQLKKAPEPTCVSSGCTGTCTPRLNRQFGERIVVGCLCM